MWPRPRGRDAWACVGGARSAAKKMKALLSVLFLSLVFDPAFCASSCDPITKFFEKKDTAYNDLLSELYSSAALPMSSNSSSDIHLLYDGITGSNHSSYEEEKFNRFRVAIQSIFDGYFAACYSSPEEKDSTKMNARKLLETFLEDLDGGANFTEMRNILGKLSCLKIFPNETDSAIEKRSTEISLLDQCIGSETIQELFACVENSLPCIFDVSSDLVCSDDSIGVQVLSADCLGFAIDTTGSMSEEINDAKSITLQFVKSEQIRTFCYVLAPFNDYEFNSPPDFVKNLDFWKVYDAQSPTDGSDTFKAYDYLNNEKQVYGVGTLIQDINNLMAHGGGDCPEFGMISLLKSIELIQGLKYDQVTLAGKHNIIVLTDASAKDDYLYTQVITKAQEANVKIHVFYSGGGCGGVGYGHFHDVAATTGGIEVTAINDVAFTAFVDYITQSSGDSTTLPPSDESMCSNFSISPFIISFSALYKTTSNIVKITDPTGQVNNLFTNGYGFVLHEESASFPGIWVVCVTSGQLEIELKTNGDLEVDVENVVQDNNTEVDILPTQQLPIACHNVTFILTASERILANISFDHPLYLNIVNEEGIVVGQTEITLCGKGFLSSLMLPYDELLQYQLQGFDIYDNPFRSYLAKRVVEFEALEWLVTLLEYPIVNPGYSSLIRASVTISREVESNLFATIKVDLPTGLTVEYMADPVIQFLPGTSSAEFQFYVTGAQSLAVEQNYTMSIGVNSSCTANYLQSFNVLVKQGVELMMINHTTDQITFTWSQPDIIGTIFYYQLTFEFDINNVVTVSLEQDSNYTYTLENLNPYQLVYVSIQATTDLGGSAAISSIPFRAAEAEPSEVRKIQGEILSNTSILLKWQEPNYKNGILLHYEITINNNVTIIITETPQCMIDDLKPFLFYEAVVRAVNSAGKGTLSTYQFYTDQDIPLAPPQYVQYTFLSSTSINVTWTQPPLETRRGFIVNYTIIVTEYNEEGIVGERIISVPGNRTYVLITELKEYSNLTLNIAAETVTGTGPIDTTCCIFIVTGVPSPPLECTATFTSSDSIVFQWKDPMERNGLILAFHLFHNTESHFTHILLSYNKSNGIYISDEYSNDTFKLYREHNFTIAAENGAGLGMNSSIITVLLNEESGLKAAVVASVTTVAIICVVSGCVIVILIVLLARRKKFKDFTVRIKYKPREEDDEISLTNSNSEPTLAYYDAKRKMSTQSSKRNGIVYSVPCGTCGKVYIGETSMPMSEILLEHRNKVKTKDQKDLLSLHVLDSAHEINWDKSTIIVYEEGIQRRQLVQQIHIKKNPNNLNLLQVNPIYDEIQIEDMAMFDDGLLLDSQ